MEEDGGKVFDATDLEKKDIVKDRYNPTSRPRRRIRAHNHGRSLVEAAKSQPDTFNKAVAYATWKAEEIRSRTEHFDMAVASSGFEANPFRWESAGWLSHVDIPFVWSWFDGARERRELKAVRSGWLSEHLNRIYAHIHRFIP